MIPACVLLLGGGQPATGADGTIITEIIRAGLVQPQGIAVDITGNAYVMGLDNAFKISPAGVITEIIDATGDAAGNVYVAGIDNAFKITPGGIITEIIDCTGDGTDNCTGDGAGNGLDFPYGIAVDHVGNIYVTGLLSDNAFKITPAGAITEIIDFTGDSTGNILFGPRGIAVDAAGNVYLAALGSLNMFKIAPDCNTNDIDDACDIDCGVMDDPCDVPGCGGSADSNGNGIPDECDTIDSGDFDGDGTVDLDDYSAFPDCMAGPDHQPQPLSPECINACLRALDFDGNNDVDLIDLAFFQTAFMAQK